MSANIHVDIEAACEDWQPFISVGGMAHLQRAVAAACHAAGVPIEAPIEIAVSLDNDAAVQVLNHRYLGLDKPTNVLSFPAFEGDALHAACAGNIGLPAPIALGDLILAYGVCARQAHEIDRDFLTHVVHLTIHGTLHLFGFDHIIESDRLRSEALERAIMAELGLPDPYPDDAHDRLGTLHG